MLWLVKDWNDVWKVITKDWHVVASKISLVVCNERRVLFWKDKCCGFTPFYITYPSLFAIATSKETLVLEV